MLVCSWIWSWGLFLLYLISSKMTNVDMFVIQIENNEGTVKDLWSTSQNLPAADS